MGGGPSCRVRTRLGANHPSSSRVVLYLAGWIVIMVVFTLAQTRFYDAHQRAHGEWRQRSTPWLLWYSSAELRAMLGALFHSDKNAAVERARRIYILVLIVGVTYMVIGFPLALLLLA